MSVNGRPFKPDPTSYQMTGIPCGNPKRYKSRGVIRMVPNPTIPFEDQQVGIPGKGTISEAELEFKKLLENQLDISHTHSMKKVNFTSSANIENFKGSAKGFMTLQDFRQCEAGDNRAIQLKNLGCTDLQITHILEREGFADTDKAPKKRKFAPHPDYVKHGMDEAELLLQQKEAELQASSIQPLHMSRHKLQLEASLLQGKQHHPLAHLYLLNQGLDSNMLKSMQADNNPGDFLAEVDVNGKHGEPKTPPYPTSNGKDEANGKHLNGSAQQHNNGASNGNGSPQNNNGTPAPPSKVTLDKPIEPIAKETIESNRVTEEEIRKIPQFANYERGAPYKVLYLKNLDKNVSVEDLVSIFIQFQEAGKDKIGFKLMNGKMKGQAFITFADEQTATKALELVNGFVFKGKPIITQYGKAK
jgi:hypothetical protein